MRGQNMPILVRASSRSLISLIELFPLLPSRPNSAQLKEIVTLIEDASWQQIPASAAPAVSDSAAPAAHPWDVLGCLLDCVRCVLEARPQPSDPSSPGALPAEEWGEVVAIACVASLRLLVPLPFDMGYAGGDRAETIR